MTLLGLFGLQWALAAHACAMMLDPSGGGHAAAASPSTPSHCATIAPKSVPQGAGLCLDHCTKGKEATGSIASTEAAAPMSVAFLTVQPSALSAIGNSGSSAQLQFRNNSPPPFALSQRLRI